MAIDPSAVGRRSEPMRVSWTPYDALLYAVAVGAGQDPLTELALTTENSADITQRVLPSFAAILTQQVARPDIGPFDRAMLLHAEQWIELHEPLATEGSADVVAQIVAIEDKGSGALVRTAVTGTDADDGRTLFNSESAAFIRGEGGFGGGARHMAWVAPSGPPDHTVVLPTRPEQALLYRLTGDRNPLHSDPGFASRAGFDRPILHGMCTFGFAGRGLIALVAGGEPGLVRSIGGRFTAPVWPGDELTLRVWSGPDAVAFQVLRPDGKVAIDRGSLTLAEGRSSGGPATTSQVPDPA